MAIVKFIGLWIASCALAIGGLSGFLFFSQLGEPRPVMAAMKAVARAAQAPEEPTDDPVASSGAEPASLEAALLPRPQMPSAPAAVRPGRAPRYELHVTAAPDVPLVRSRVVLSALPAWRVEQGLYSGTELDEWRAGQQVTFVPNGAAVEVVERAEGLVRLRVRGGPSAGATGWTYEAFVRRAGT